MLSKWSQRRRHQSCRWSLHLLLGLLKLFEIVEAIALAKMPTDISTLTAIETKVISRTGEDVTFYCRLDFPLSDVQISWYHLGQDGSYDLIQKYPFENYFMEEPAVEYLSRTFFAVMEEEAALTLKDVRPQDSGTYKCVQKNNQHSVSRYIILQVTAPKEKDENSVVIYTLVGFLSVSLVVWLISFGILCKRGDLQCPWNWESGNVI